ncbi:MAG: flavin-containing monooxygenase [Sandaracinaceae bacterium]
MTEHFDVLVIGAGLSGIGAAYHLETRRPDSSFAVLESRAQLGGTWDLFRYPGIRSDSDMHTLGFSFKPWRDDKAIAEGPAILRYLQEAVEENGLASRIRYGHAVEAAHWSSETARWTLSVRVDGELRELTAGFLFTCCGYYDYEAGHTPEFDGRDTFEGQVVHPQHWPDDLDYDGKRVVVIGSGATAVTLVPELAKRAAHVTMLQRSPTYFISRPWTDPVALALRSTLGDQRTYELVRWKNILLQQALYQFCRRAPRAARTLLMSGVRHHVGPDIDVERHFNPSYDPWDQRVCLVPDADLFAALRSGAASIVTDRIARFVPDGIELEQRQSILEADLVVTATGLRLRFMGGIEVTVDGERVDPGERAAYRGIMISGVPNLAFAFGYVNASWTLRADLTSEFVCRLLNHMDRHDARRCVPLDDGSAGAHNPFWSLSSGYVRRAMEHFPKQGERAPFRAVQSYFEDRASLRNGSLDDGVLELR